MRRNHSFQGAAHGNSISYRCCVRIVVFICIEVLHATPWRQDVATAQWFRTSQGGARSPASAHRFCGGHQVGSSRRPRKCTFAECIDNGQRWRLGPSGDGKGTASSVMYSVTAEGFAPLSKDSVDEGGEPVPINDMRSYTNSSALADFAHASGGFGGYMIDEHGIRPVKPEPGMSTTTNKSYVMSLSDLLDFLTPLVGGVGRRGVSADRSLQFHSAYFHTRESTGKELFVLRRGRVSRSSGSSRSLVLRRQHSATSRSSIRRERRVI